MLNTTTALPPQISLQFQQYPPKPQDSLIELIVDKRTTIRQCLDQLIIAVGLGSELAETLCLQTPHFLVSLNPKFMHILTLTHVTINLLSHSFIGDAFHLRKSNWCGEATELIEDEVSHSCVCLLLVSYRRACLPPHLTPTSPRSHLTSLPPLLALTSPHSHLSSLSPHLTSTSPHSHLTSLPPHPTLISPHFHSHLALSGGDSGRAKIATWRPAIH